MSAQQVTANTAPEFAAATAERSVAENTVAGENIGDPVAATDADDDMLTYTLGGTDMASFAIDPATGQLMTMAALDFETKTSYSVTVTASDDEDSATVMVTIMVTDVDEEVTLLERYDTDNNGLDKSEVLKAINDYLFGTGDDTISKADVLELINLATSSAKSRDTSYRAVQERRSRLLQWL